MKTTRKLAIGFGIAGGAFLAAWLLSGSRKKRTKDFLVQKVADLKKSIQKNYANHDDSHTHYV